MLLLGIFPRLSLARRRHSVRFSRLDVIPISPPIMSRATRRRSETTASARQGVASLGTKPRQSRTPAPSMTIRVTIGQRMRADSVLGFPQPVPSLQRDVGLRQAVSRPEAGRAEPVGRDRAQLIEPGAMMGAAQRFPDQPPDVVELRIVGRQHSVGAHGVERIEKAARPVGAEGRRLPRVLGASRRSGVASSRPCSASSISCGDLRMRLVGFLAALI